VLSGEIRIRAVRKGEDQIGSRKFRALKSLEFALCTPSMDASCPLSHGEREGPAAKRWEGERVGTSTGVPAGASV
jgi:hypothetical protein